MAMVAPNITHRNMVVQLDPNSHFGLWKRLHHVLLTYGEGFEPVLHINDLMGHCGLMNLS